MSWFVLLFSENFPWSVIKGNLGMAYMMIWEQIGDQPVSIWNITDLVH